MGAGSTDPTNHPNSERADRAAGRHLTTAEFAERIGMSTAYVSRKCHAGAIRAVKLGNTWRIPSEAVAEFMVTETPQPDAVASARPDLSVKQRRAVEQRLRTGGGSV